MVGGVPRVSGDEPTEEEMLANPPESSPRKRG